MEKKRKKEKSGPKKSIFRRNGSKTVQNRKKGPRQTRTFERPLKFEVAPIPPTKDESACPGRVNYYRPLQHEQSTPSSVRASNTLFTASAPLDDPSVTKVIPVVHRLRLVLELSLVVSAGSVLRSCPRERLRWVLDHSRPDS
jgi:hypothetical protein